MSPEKLPVTRAAVVQATPVLFDREATLKKTIRLLGEAAHGEPQLILFPEAFIPGYPRHLSFGTTVGNRSASGKETWNTFWENSLEVPSRETKRLGEAVKETGAFTAIGVVEREHGTLYCTLLYYAPDGTLLGKHRKLKPTAAERIIWGEGDGSTLMTFNTPAGIIGGLICWENYMPLARMAIYCKGVQVYLAPTADQRDTWQVSMQHIALEGRCFVLSANQYLTSDRYPEEIASREKLARDGSVLCRGGSAIYSPSGELLAGPLWDQEGMLFADLDLREVSLQRMDLDVAGHYNRPDVFRFAVPDQPETKPVKENNRNKE